MKNKLKEVLSEIKYPVFAGMKPEVSFKTQFSDDAFDYIINEMIIRGVMVVEPSVDLTEKQLDNIINKAFDVGMAYGIIEVMKNEGRFEGIETKRLVKELLKDVK